MNKTHGKKSLYFLYEYNHHPHKFGENANAVNLELYKYITSNLRDGPVMGGGSITESTDLHVKPDIDLYNTFKSTSDDLQVQSVEIIDHVLPWINHQLAEASFEFAQSGEDAGYAGFNTEGLVGSGTTVSLSTTAEDIDVVTFAIHYNGGGTGTAGNYTVLATKNNGYRYGSIGF